MSTTILAAGASAADNFGFMNAMKQGGPVTWTTAAILTIFLFFTLYILFTKLFEQQKIINQGRRVRATFWNANSLREGAAKLEKNSAYKQIVDDGIEAQEQHSRLTDPVEAHDWLHGSLSRSEAAINSQLGGGLAFLATVGATAPFVGLFGTVLGIYRALIGIGQAGQASIDKVAGPVGESLIMTAFGLVVAVPAVLAFNFLQRRNKAIAEHLSAFSTDVLGYLASNGAVRPAAPGKKAPTATAPKPATTTAGQAGGVQTRV
ncbi:MAG: MotA/TolQ/ExbB proton channel family protein [Sphingomonas sp.]|jgi:biopolymer transport protein ExbB|uniref:MotA/TolQ/ExbB proton channel family protein n=1 Tax=unclassified Sphingomonas TaxID=196159 RepID=UPI00053DC09B|nr:MULTISPECIES: MotA/TolQ/ExbB proton channel family protein [unclassified Sphingomonas]MDR6849890.1 biopolymer transport protein ExbB [Sphingomonas sp. BE137]MDR7257391.1 biopolymer transport protein ExbB [Sphingomonas sp. BE270]